MQKTDKIYTTCYDLSLRKFVACLCDGNLKALNKKGSSAKSEELQFAWAEIEKEYIMLMNKGATTPEVMLAFEIERMRYRYISITKGLELLRHTRDDEIVSMLKTEGFFYDFNSSDRNKYLTDILKSEKKAARIAIEIKDRQDLLEQMTQGRGNADIKIDKQYFVNNLTTLSRFNGFQVTDKISVAMYVTYVNQFIEYNEKQKSKKDVGNRTH